MNQIRFMITATLVSLMITSGIASSSAASALITPLQKTMTLEQLLLWIQQYNLNHPENPIVLDMNTILSAPPQQIKTIIETHINTVTHSNNNNNDDDDQVHKRNKHQEEPPPWLTGNFQ